MCEGEDLPVIVFYGWVFSDVFVKATTLDAMQNGFRPMVSLDVIAVGDGDEVINYCRWWEKHAETGQRRSSAPISLIWVRNMQIL